MSWSHDVTSCGHPWTMMTSLQFPPLFTCAGGDMQRRASSADHQGARLPTTHCRQPLLLRPVQLVLHSTSSDRHQEEGPPSRRGPRRRRRPRRHVGEQLQSARSRAHLGRLPVLLVLSAEASRVDHGRPQLPASTAVLPSSPRPNRQGMRLCRPHSRLNRVLIRKGRMQLDIGLQI